MVDTFRATYPNTAYRYSCFEGLRRFTNRGNRIDYILMDESLWDHVKLSTSNSSLFTGSLTDENDNLSDKEQALHAVTNNKKLSKDSSFEPSDIKLDDVRLHTHQVPHTGRLHSHQIRKLGYLREEYRQDQPMRNYQPILEALD